VKERVPLWITLSSRQGMVMNFRPWRAGVYVFSSIYKKVMKLSIHSHEGYGVAFKPVNRRSRVADYVILLTTLCAIIFW
jgi:hypothetical protein